MDYYPQGDLLFNSGDLRATLRAHMEQMLGRIDEVPADRILGTDPDALADYFEAEFLVNVPELDIAATTVEQTDQKVDVSRDQSRMIHDRSRPFYVPGTTVEFHVPFTGDIALFKMQASTFSSNPPRARVANDAVILHYETTDHNPDQLRKAFDRHVEQIRQHLQWQRVDVDAWNRTLRPAALNRIHARRQKLLADQQMVTGLGFPLRRRDGAPTTYAVPTPRRKAARLMPTPDSAPAQPIEPALDPGVYEEILSIMDNMVTVMEQSPTAFQTMGEEDLRTHFLVQLNGQYEGSATGETFNYEGKTDILIKHKNRNVFVAECMIWEGPQTLLNKVDQLLGYASWRDTKTAILVFSRRKGFSKVVAQIDPTIRSHPNVVRAIEIAGETRTRYILHHRDDPDRLLTLTVLAYDIPAPG